MKLHSPAFERALRRNVRRVVRSSPELKRESRRNRRARRFQAGPLVRAALSAGLGALVLFVQRETGHLASALAVIGLWSLAFMFVRAQNLRANLYNSTDLPALISLPVQSDLVFRWELQKAGRASLWSLLDLLLGFGALVWALDLDVLHGLAAFAVAVVSWLAMIALAAQCAARLPRLPYPLITGMLYFGGLGLVLTRTLIGSALLQALDNHAAEINLLLPTSWAPSLFHLCLPDRQWWALAFLVPTGLLITALPNAIAHVRRTYDFSETVMPEAPDLVPGAEPLAESSARVEKPSRVGLSEIEETIQSREFLKSVSWPGRGWIEERLWGWLTERQKVVADFAFPGGFPILPRWWSIFRNLAVSALIALAIRSSAPGLAFWIAGIGVFISGCQVLAQVLMTGAAFRLAFVSGVNTPLYATYGIGFRELANLLFKCSMIQAPLLILFTMACGALAAGMLSVPIAIALGFGIKVGLLLLAARFITVTLGFSSGTNDSARMRFYSLGFLPAILGFGGAFLALGVSGLFVQNPLLAYALLALDFVVAYGLFRIYGGFYHSNCFDLMNLPKR